MCPSSHRGSAYCTISYPLPDSSSIRNFGATSTCNPSHAIYCLLKVRRVKFDPEVLTIAKRHRGTGAAAARERVKYKLARQSKAANEWSQSCDRLEREAGQPQDPDSGAGCQMTACLFMSRHQLGFARLPDTPAEFILISTPLIAVLLGKACLTKLAAHGAEDLIILRQCFHLMPETPVPQCHQSSFFCEDAVFDASNVFLPKA